MKKAGKRFISIVLSVMMVLGMLSVSIINVAAAEENIPDIYSGWYWPLSQSFKTISSGFGYRADMGDYHQGIDISSGGIGGQPIYAARKGTVVYVGVYYDCGNMVSIRHGTYNGATIYTTYMHMQYKGCVSVGQEVDQSTIIGYVGGTGTNGQIQYGVHLHFQICKNDKNPAHSNNSQLNANYYNPASFSYSYDHSKPTVTTPPTWATLTADKSSLPLGGSITFTMNSDNASYYNITIYRSINSGSSVEQVKQELYYYSNTYTFTPTQEGNYTAYISAYNGVEPHVDGNNVKFTVYGHPNWATLTADKSLLPLGDSITFTMDSDTAKYYNITILRTINSGAATEQAIQKLYHYSNTYTFTPTKEGDYTAYISAYNEVEPHADGNNVKFTVYGHPTWATLTADKSSLPLGDSITFTMDSDTAKYYNITILRTINSGAATEQAIQKLYHYSNTYTFTPTKEGDYTAYISAYNEVEPHADGNSVKFTVYALPTQYTLTYNPNGGANPPENQIGNGTMTLSSAIPSRDGFTFLGWATNAGATEAQYQPGGEFDLTEDITLYAMWEEDVQVEIIAKEGSDTYIDEDNGLIFGVESNLNESQLRSRFIGVKGNGDIEISASSRRMGTGTIITLCDAQGNEIKSYTLVVFGDVDGNGIINQSDVIAANEGLSTGFEHECYKTAANVVITRRNDRFTAQDVAELLAMVQETGVDQAETADTLAYYVGLV